MTAHKNAPDVVKSTEPGQEAALPRGCHARRLARVVPGGDYARAQACVLAWGGAPDKKATSFVCVGEGREGRSGGVLQMATVARERYPCVPPGTRGEPGARNGRRWAT